MNLKRISKTQFNIFNSKQYRLSIIILLLFIHYSGLTNCLNIKDLVVPSFVRNGSAIYLNCNFELGTNEELYSVKWYKDNVEFYRYLPSNEPHQGKFYRLKGIHVDLQGSNSTHVLLYRMEVTSEGTYSCEVSTDQFITAVALKQLKVYALPQDKLRIEGSEFEYDVGHLINLTCICPPTKPTAQLAWYINGKKAPSNLLIKYSSPKNFNQTKKNYLENSKLGLIFQTKRSDFANGQLWLKCVASLVLNYNFETSQNLDNSKTSSEHRIMVNTGKVLASSTSSSDLYLKQKETPVINGLRTTYHVGDSLILNCSTTEKDAKLKWYINDKLVNSSYLIYYTNQHNSNDKLKKNEIDFYESKPYQLNNVYYNNAANAHELKRRTFSIHKTNTQKINGIRRSLNYPNILRQIQNSITYNNTKQILGLQMPLQQYHFQYDVKLKCESTIQKHVAQLEQSLKIFSENHELAKMQSSIAFAYSNFANHQLTQLLLTLFSLFINKLYLNNLQN